MFSICKIQLIHRLLEQRFIVTEKLKTKNVLLNIAKTSLKFNRIFIYIDIKK